MGINYETLLGRLGPRFLNSASVSSVSSVTMGRFYDVPLSLSLGL